MKIAKTIAIITLVLVVAYLLDVIRGKNESYRALKELADARDIEHAQSVEKIKVLDMMLAEKDERVKEIERLIVAKSARIVVLEYSLAAIQGEEPPTTPDIEAMPIVINLRAQVATLTELRAEDKGVIEAQAEEISTLKIENTLLKQAVAEWKLEYEREHALRLMAQDMVRSGEKSATVYKVIAAAGVALALLK